MESFKGKVRQVTETIHHTAQRGRERKASMVSERFFNHDGNITEERYRKRKHINRITYLYNKKGKCVEMNEYDCDHVLFFRYRFKYDRWGHQIEEQRYTPKGGVDQTQSRRYDEKGQEVEHRMRKGERAEGIEYQYDEAGHIIEEKHLRNGEVTSCYTYQYDDKENLILDQQQHKDGTLLVSRYQYRYDSQDRIIDELVMNADNKVENHYTFAYDDFGNRTQNCQYLPDGTFLGRHITFDNNNHKLQERWFNSDEGTCGYNTFTYNDHGQLSEEASYSGRLAIEHHTINMGDNELVHQTHYTCDQRRITYQLIHSYNDEGHETEQHEQHFDREGNVTIDTRKYYNHEGLLIEEVQNNMRDVYQYDTHGNWTRKEHYCDGELELVNERHIEYFG